MDPLQERIEIQMAFTQDDDLAVEHKLLLWHVAQSFNQFGKIPSQWLSGLGLNQDFVVLAKRKAAKPIPFRFIEPFLSFRERDGVARLHRRKRRMNRKID